jgi:tetratricopeptide (TPR) repeat protein
MKIGYEVDLAYFFLGRAAEEMGYYDAAMKYYKYSLALYDDPEASHHCRTITLRDYCAGVNIGLAAPERMDAVQVKIDKGR